MPLRFADQNVGLRRELSRLDDLLAGSDDWQALQRLKDPESTAGSADAASGPRRRGEIEARLASNRVYRARCKIAEALAILEESAQPAPQPAQQPARPDTLPMAGDEVTLGKPASADAGETPRQADPGIAGMLQIAAWRYQDVTRAREASSEPSKEGPAAEPASRNGGAADDHGGNQAAAPAGSRTPGEPAHLLNLPFAIGAREPARAPADSATVAGDTKQNPDAEKAPAPREQDAGAERGPKPAEPDSAAAESETQERDPGNGDPPARQTEEPPAESSENLAAMGKQVVAAPTPAETAAAKTPVTEPNSIPKPAPHTGPGPLTVPVIGPAAQKDESGNKPSPFAADAPTSAMAAAAPIAPSSDYTGDFLSLPFVAETVPRYIGTAPGSERHDNAEPKSAFAPQRKMKDAPRTSGPDRPEIPDRPSRATSTQGAAEDAADEMAEQPGAAKLKPMPSPAPANPAHAESDGATHAQPPKSNSALAEVRGAPPQFQVARVAPAPEADVNFVTRETSRDRDSDPPATLEDTTQPALAQLEPRPDRLETKNESHAAYHGDADEASVVIVHRDSATESPDLPFYKQNEHWEREGTIRRFLKALTGD